MKDISQHLELEISKAVDLIMAASEAAAAEALGRAFDRPGSAQRRGGRSGGSRATSKPASGRDADRTTVIAHRSREEISVLEERLSEAISAAPGETMKVLANRLGVGCRELQVPASRLRSARRIKTIGERQRTRYFPMGSVVSESEVGGGLGRAVTQQG